MQDLQSSFLADKTKSLLVMSDITILLHKPTHTHKHTMLNSNHTRTHQEMR